jgi:uncharacterized membrane protein
VRDDELGMDRTVAATWPPNAEWPASADEGPDDEDADDSALEAERPNADGGAAVGESVVIDEFDGVDIDELADEDGVEAVAAIEGHPLHPALVPLPIGSFVGAFLCDVAYTRTHDRFWARGARLLTGAGIVTGLAAGSLGALDFTGRARIRARPAAWVHGAGNLAVIGLAAASEKLRARDEGSAVGRGSLALSAASVAVLAVTGWLGGELAFRDRIGVTSR